MLQQAIQKLTAGKTVVMIAHKIKTIMNAGQIIVMDNGRVHGIGTHEVLLQSDEILPDFLGCKKNSISMENLKGELQTMNNKLQGKDLITIGIYTALYIVAIFVASVANVTPLTFMFYPAISSLLGAVFFVMLATKVQKFGAVIIWGVIVDCFTWYLAWP